MAKRVGKYKITKKRESAISLVDGGTRYMVKLLVATTGIITKFKR